MLHRASAPVIRRPRTSGPGQGRVPRAHSTQSDGVDRWGTKRVQPAQQTECRPRQSGVWIGYERSSRILTANSGCRSAKDSILPGFRRLIVLLRLIQWRYACLNTPFWASSSLLFLLRRAIRKPVLLLKRTPRCTRQPTMFLHKAQRPRLGTPPFPRAIQFVASRIWFVAFRI